MKKLSLIFLFGIFQTLSSKAQFNNNSTKDTSFYDEKWRKAYSMKDANVYGLIYHDEVNKDKVLEVFYQKTGGQKIAEKNFLAKEMHGTSKDWYESGQLKREMEYKSGKLEGNLTMYWENGKAKRIDTYKNGKFKTGQCFDADGNNMPYLKYEQPAEFLGGAYGLGNYLRNEIALSNQSKSNFPGQVTVAFLVNKDGDIERPEIAKSSNNNQLDSEAIRIVKAMPKWIPGTQDGEVTNKIYRLLIDFSIVQAQKDPFR